VLWVCRMTGVVRGWGMGRGSLRQAAEGRPSFAQRIGDEWRGVAGGVQHSFAWWCAVELRDAG